MKRIFTTAMIGVIAFALSTGFSVPAPADAPSYQRLERRLSWSEHHIEKLKARNDYLHRYIRHMRREHHSYTPAASTGTLRITEAQAAAAMRAAGFPEAAIQWFNNGVIQRESGYCPTAVYPGHCTGDTRYFYAGGPACSLFQLFHCPGPQAADPYVAARYAYAKFKASGYSPWGG